MAACLRSHSPCIINASSVTSARTSLALNCACIRSHIDKPRSSALAFERVARRAHRTARNSHLIIDPINKRRGANPDRFVSLKLEDRFAYPLSGAACLLANLFAFVTTTTEMNMNSLKALLFYSRSLFPLILIAAAVTSPALAQTARRNPAADYYNRGNDRQKERDLDGAIEDYTFAITFEPKFALAWNNRGVVRYLKGDFDEAIKDFGKAVELKPDYAEAWNNRGNARFDKGDPDGAIADFDKAIALNDHYAQAYHSRANARHAKKDLDGAISDYTRAIDLNERFALSWHNRGSARQEKGELREAVADFDQAIKLDPNRAITWAYRGLTLLMQGKGAEAERDFARCLELNPDLKATLSARINEVKQQRRAIQ